MTPPNPDKATLPGPAPLDLPRLVMRRAALVGVLVLMLAVVLGLARMNDDIDDEVEAAMTLASLMARLGQLAQNDERHALEDLRTLQAEHPLRHLVLRVQAADGRSLLEPAVEATPVGPLAWLLAWHRHWTDSGGPRQVAWTVRRPDGERWTVTLTSSHESERREAMGSLIDMLALLLACVTGLLLAMRWNVRRAFAPLGTLLDAIARIEANDIRTVQALPPMPIRELEAVAAALRHLAAALDEAEAQRRQLSRQVLTLQEDERARLARELHDEFGQRLTAMRADAAWLARRLHDDEPVRAVVAGVAVQCQLIQQDVRSLLARLQPFGPDDRCAGETPRRLAALLHQLVATWSSPGRERWGSPGHEGATRYRLQLDRQARAGSAVEAWLSGPMADQVALPRPLALVLYRISQEALTNVARHARAGQAVLRIGLVGDWSPGATVQIDWSVEDDGVGVADSVVAARQGNGLAGLRERVWAQGGDLRMSSAHADRAGRPGWRLQAMLATTWMAPPADEVDDPMPADDLQQPTAT